MDDRSPQGTRNPVVGGAGRGAGEQSGGLGIALAAVLAAAFAQGSWQWFATYIGVTLLAVILSFGHLPGWSPALRSAYARSLTAYSLIVGLCVAITVAPALQRWEWLFPMPGTRRECARSGHSRRAVAECLAATTTVWLPVYAAGTAVLVGVGTWLWGRARARRQTAGAT